MCAKLTTSNIKQKMHQNPSSSSKIDRKTAEKSRRKEMNSLYTELTSLVPCQSPTEIVCVSEQLEAATKYIKQLQESVESMKEQIVLMKSSNNASFRSSFCRDSSSCVKLPRMDLDFCGSTLDVVLMTGLKHERMFKHTLRILHEEAADVVSASFSVVDHTVFHTLHSKIGGCGLEYEAAARISERLKKLVINDDHT